MTKVVKKMSKLLNFITIGPIWNHHEKCIQQSTNMRGIGSLIREIDIKNFRNLRKKTHFLLSKTNAPRG